MDDKTKQRRRPMSQAHKEKLRLSALQREGKKRLAELARVEVSSPEPTPTTSFSGQASDQQPLTALPEVTLEPAKPTSQAATGPAKQPTSEPSTPATVITSADIQFYATAPEATLDAVVRCLCDRLGKVVTRGDVLKFIGDSEGCESWAQYCKKVCEAERIKRDAAVNSKARGGDLKAVQFIADQQASGAQSISPADRRAIDYYNKLQAMTPEQIRARIAERQASCTREPGTFGFTGKPLPPTCRIVEQPSIAAAESISTDLEAPTPWDSLTPEVQAWVCGFQPDAATTHPSICRELAELYILVVDSQTDAEPEPTAEPSTAEPEPLTKE